MFLAVSCNTSTRRRDAKRNNYSCRSRSRNVIFLIDALVRLLAKGDSTTRSSIKVERSLLETYAALRKQNDLDSFEIPPSWNKTRSVTPFWNLSLLNVPRCRLINSMKFISISIETLSSRKQRSSENSRDRTRNESREFRNFRLERLILIPMFFVLCFPVS